MANNKKFVADMKGYATNLVKYVKEGTAKLHNDNTIGSTFHNCGKYLLKGKGKNGRMVVC